MVIWVLFGFESMVVVVGGCKRDEEEKIKVNIFFYFILLCKLYYFNVLYVKLKPFFFLFLFFAITKIWNVECIVK